MPPRVPVKNVGSTGRRIELRRKDIRSSRINEMSKSTYRVVKHDGGWAYEANGTYSEQFQTREAARKAAKLAAIAQAAANEITPPPYEDKNGRWYYDGSG